MSWGSDDVTLYSGYVAINGNRVVSTTSADYMGFNLVEASISSCSATNMKHFDTYGSQLDSENMATYIISLALNTVLIGITSDDVSLPLTQNVKSALLAIGVSVNGLQIGGKMSFVATIGQPSMTVSRVASSVSSNLKLAVNASGN